MKRTIKKSSIILLFVLLILLILSFLLFILFLKNNYKKDNTGNNITNKSLDEKEQYILDINAFDAMIEVTINSNKNTNKYIIKQFVNNEEIKQEVIEPENIRGIEISYKNDTLTIYNSKIDLKKIYENYPCITENILFLNDFIDQYKQLKAEGLTSIEETENYIVLTVYNKSNNNLKQQLFVRKSDGKPDHIIRNDNNNKILVYILYKEINIR